MNTMLGTVAVIIMALVVPGSAVATIDEAKAMVEKAEAS